MINMIYAASAKLYIHIGVGARDIDEAHMVLDIFSFVVFLFRKFSEEIREWQTCKMFVCFSETFNDFH